MLGPVCQLALPAAVPAGISSQLFAVRGSDSAYGVLAASMVDTCNILQKVANLLSRVRKTTRINYSVHMQRYQVHAAASVTC
jgi:hypothetical protein